MQNRRVAGSRHEEVEKGRSRSRAEYIHHACKLSGLDVICVCLIVRAICLLPLCFFGVFFRFTVHYSFISIQPFLFGGKMCCCYGSIPFFFRRINPGNEFVNLKLLFSLAYICLRGVCARAKQRQPGFHEKLKTNKETNSSLFNKMCKACAPFLSKSSTKGAFSSKTRN